MQLQLPDTSAIQSRKISLSTQARDIVIQNDADNFAAAELLKTSRILMREIDVTFDPLKKDADRLHKSIVAAQNQHRKPVEEVERILKGKMSAYRTVQEQVRRAEEARIRAELERREEERREAEAKQLMDEGHFDEAGELLSSEFSPPAPVAVFVPAPPQPQGISARNAWDFRITNPDKLPRRFLVPDEKAIRAVVKAMGNRAPQEIPGIEVFERTDIAVRIAE